MNTQTATVTAINPSLEIESTNAPLVNVNNTSAMVLNGDSMEKMLKFSQMMATSKITIPKHLQGNAGDCFAIVMQAMQWGMNPFAVAQKTHLVNGVLGYEAQLVNAVINSRAPITTRLNYEWFGDWSKVNGKTSNADEEAVQIGRKVQGDGKMTVKECLDLICFYSRWKLIGARTGKVIATSSSKKKTLEKWLDYRVVGKPLSAYVEVSKKFDEMAVSYIAVIVVGL